MRRLTYFPAIILFCFLFLLLLNDSAIWGADQENYTFKNSHPAPIQILILE